MADDELQDLRVVGLISAVLTLLIAILFSNPVANIVLSQTTTLLYLYLFYEGRSSRDLICCLLWAICLLTNWFTVLV